MSPVDRTIATFSLIFSLKRDTDEQGTVENIRQNVDFHSANAWTLVFAIFVASIGLNINSAAVIIGAMLISPLMGPILGFGLALGINDTDLLKRSLRNLSIAVVISVLTSTLYFLLSPLHDAQSELLARTQPSFYDVMIAFFGGAAGIISISRKQRGAAVSGVAIATALMPPLCTAGFALSNGNFKFLAGALYLFLINCVFIGLSTFLFVRYMGFTKVKYEKHSERRRLRIWISTIVVLVVVPSLVLAWKLMQESRFNIRSERFIREQFQFKNSLVVSSKFNFRYREPEIIVNLVGATLAKEQIENLKSKLPQYQLPTAKLDIRQISDDDERLNALASATDIELAHLKRRVSETESSQELELSIKSELSAIVPEVYDVLFSRDKIFVVWLKKPMKATTGKVESYLKIRAGNDSLETVHAVRN